MTPADSIRDACALCGDREATLRIEHIYGDWLAKHLEKRNLRSRTRGDILFDRFDGTWERDIRQEKQFQHVLELKVLCEDCNSGWGGTLEGKAKALLIPLIDGRAGTVAPEGCAVLATWMAKVALLRELRDTPRMRVTPAADRHEFRRTGVPPTGMWLFAGTLDAGITWRSRDEHSVFVGELPPMAGPRRTEHFQTWAFGFEDLFFVAVRTPSIAPIRDLSRAVPDALVRIWPNPEGFTWPRPLRLDDSGADALSTERVELWWGVAPDGPRISDAKRSDPPKPSV